MFLRKFKIWFFCSIFGILLSRGLISNFVYGVFRPLECETTYKIFTFLFVEKFNNCLNNKTDVVIWADHNFSTKASIKTSSVDSNSMGMNWKPHWQNLSFLCFSIMASYILSNWRMCHVCRRVVVRCCQLISLPSGLTSMKLEKRIQKMYTFTYLRLPTFMLQSIQSKIVATMRKAKI